MVFSPLIHLFDVESQDAEQEDTEDVDDGETQTDQTSEEQLQGDVTFRVLKLKLEIFR